MIAVSACLLGINCKYNGNNNKNDKVVDYLKDKEYILICPEQLGGLSTPRKPSEIVDGDGYDVINNYSNIIDNTGKDVTKEFINGANECLKIAKMYGCKKAILKEGTFSGKKIPGVGTTTALFKNNKIKVINEYDIL